MAENNRFMSDEDKKQILDAEKKAAIQETSGMEKTAAMAGQRYPSPFLNLSDMQLPDSSIEIFKWCKYYYVFDPLISGAINALATFPVTEIQLQNPDENEKEKSKTTKLYEKVLFRTLNIYKLLIEIGIDYQLYGNCFVMGQLTGRQGEQEWSNITRLDPSKIKIEYNAATGQEDYIWDVPDNVQRIVRSKQPIEEYEKIPDIIKEAVMKKESVRLNRSKIYHFSRATDSMGSNSVWGVPLITNVLKLLMYRNVLRQAQEAIAREHIVPLRIFYIDRTREVNPNGNWQASADDLAERIQRGVLDPNYKIVSPVPVNVINVGGEGRSLLLAPEIEQLQGEILAGMGVPREFIFGGVSYSGSSISLRILENNFITYRLLLVDFLQNFIIKEMAKARGEWNTEADDDLLPKVKLADLKMQDDVQQKQMIIQLNAAGKCSNSYLWKTFGIDPEKMQKSIEEEAIAAVELKAKTDQITLEAQLKSMDLQEKIQLRQAEMSMKIQMQQQQIQEKIQQEMQQQAQQQQVQAPEQQSSNRLEEEINKLALSAIKLSKEEQQAISNKLNGNVKQLFEQKLNELEQAYKQQQAQENTQADMRPMPEQKPPRRESIK